MTDGPGAVQSDCTTWMRWPSGSSSHGATLTDDVRVEPVTSRVASALPIPMRWKRPTLHVARSH